MIIMIAIMMIINDGYDDDDDDFDYCGDNHYFDDSYDD